MGKIKSPNVETNESVDSIQLRSHSVDDNLYKKRDSNVAEESFPKRKITDVHNVPYSKKKSIVDNILQNRLFGSGAAKIEEVEDDPSQVVNFLMLYQDYRTWARKWHPMRGSLQRRLLAVNRQPTLILATKAAHTC